MYTNLGTRLKFSICESKSAVENLIKLTNEVSNKFPFQYTLQIYPEKGSRNIINIKEANKNKINGLKNKKNERRK